MGWLGYALMVLELVGLAPLLLPRALAFEAGMLLAFYGIYFGVLSRDIAAVCSDVMAHGLGVQAAPI
jgi:RING finger protein 121/175